MSQHRMRLYLVFLGLVVAASSARAASPYTVVDDRGIPARMRDGVILFADIYRPSAEGKFPVLLMRTPYDKNNNVNLGLDAAARGYVMIVQDVRGRYSSQGEWYPFKHEADDGFDTVEWAAALPYSNGKVGMYGGSYVGVTTMQAAIAHPPHLAGVCVVATGSDYHNGWTYQGGAFEQWFNQTWTTLLAQDTLDRRVRNNGAPLNGTEKLPLADYSPLSLPPAAPDKSQAAMIAPYFLDWLAHPRYDDYWKRWSIAEHLSDITVPALTVAGWYDIFQGGSLRNYVGMRQHAGTEASRHGQHLIVILGGHAGFGRQVGDVDFGADAAFAEPDAMRDWFDYLLKGVQNEFAGGKRVKIFVMGANRWREEDEWPLARALNTRYFLHSAGNAASLHGDGTLSTPPPGAEPFDHYVYDPANPAPTVGGPLCCDSSHFLPGARDQRSVEARPDVLVYSTPPFTHNVEITGPVSVELYAKSSAVDTDFTAKLVDVRPDGFAQNLTEGIIRARYRDSQESPNLLKPGEIHKFTIDLWSTSNVFLVGHRLRLEISSSNFPRFDRNLNTGEDAAAATKWVSATNAIYHDAQHPSVLILPIVPFP